MNIKLYTKPIASLYERLTKSGNDVVKKLKMSSISGPTRLTDIKIRENDVLECDFNKVFRKSASENEMKLNYEELENSRKNGPSW